jgi:GT2 family glycosyltransferase
VALPARNEEARIADCLNAINNQVSVTPDHVVLLLNNCSDRTAELAYQLRPHLRFELHITHVQLPAEKANAGHARHLAFKAAAPLAGDDGILLTTDADGQVDPDWIEANMAAIRKGADAVAGWAELDPNDWGNIPLRLHEDDARECAYDLACDEIHAMLNPDAADPLPRHTQASGASIAVTIKAYRAAGGIPQTSSGEDRAFIAALRRVDARIRHAPECRVVVSGRTQGRAAGGMADTIRRRLMVPDLYLDDRLEPAEVCARRASLRHLTRAVYDGNGFPSALARELGIELRALRAFLTLPTFGSAWDGIEQISPRLVRQRVSTADLPRQQALAEMWRDRARQDPAACREAIMHSSSVG